MPRCYHRDPADRRTGRPGTAGSERPGSATVSLDRWTGCTGRARIVTASWIGDAVFLVASLPAVFGGGTAEEVAAVVCLALFLISLGVWGWAFAIAVVAQLPG